MWTNENRGRYDRSRLRDPSDVTAEAFALVAPIIPPPKRGGNKRHGNIREVSNGLMSVLRTAASVGRQRTKPALKKGYARGLF